MLTQGSFPPRNTPSFLGQSVLAKNGCLSPTDRTSTHADFMFLTHGKNPRGISVNAQRVSIAGVYGASFHSVVTQSHFSMPSRTGSDSHPTSQPSRSSCSSRVSPASMNDAAPYKSFSSWWANCFKSSTLWNRLLKIEMLILHFTPFAEVQTVVRHFRSPAAYLAGKSSFRHQYTWASITSA